MSYRIPQSKWRAFVWLFEKTHKIKHVSYEQFVDMSKEFFARLGDEQEIEEERKYRKWRENSKEYIVRYLREEIGITQE